jgi:hypothetical protein
VPFPPGRHVRPPNHKPMPSRAGNTAAHGECRNSVTPVTVVRLKAPRHRTASQNGAVAESSGARAAGARNPGRSTRAALATSASQRRGGGLKLPTQWWPPLRVG